jgi:isoleucyl-tRNA synthetase
LQGAYRLTKKFIVEEVAEFYLEFAKDRLLVKQAGTGDSLST